MFEFQNLNIEGLVVVTTDSFSDERGFFRELYKEESFKKAGIRTVFVQDNFSHSKQHVLRGLHYQKKPIAQEKLVWVLRGEIFDVAVDLRSDSETYGKWEGVKLSAKNRKGFIIPKGFAHGFVVLSTEANVLYKTDAMYSPEHEAGLVWNDKDVAIDWPVKDPILSERDKVLPKISEIPKDLF